MLPHWLDHDTIKLLILEMNPQELYSLAAHIASELYDDPTDNDIHDLQKIITNWQKEREKQKSTTALKKKSAESKRAKTIKSAAPKKKPTTETEEPKKAAATKSTTLESKKAQWPPATWTYEDSMSKKEYNELMARLKKKGDEYVYDVARASYIYNPDSGFWVGRTGAVGKKITAKYGYGNLVRWSMEYLEQYGREGINATV
jgi:hypothetical protein